MKQGQRKSLMESSIGVKVLTAVMVCLGCLPAAAQQNRIDLPDMGASADSVLSRAEEEEYAKALIRQMRAYDVLVDDPLIANFFEDMGFRLASHSDRPDKSFTFETKSAPASYLLKVAAGLKPVGKRNRPKGSEKPGRETAAYVTAAQVREIAEQKMKDLSANDVEAAMKIILGSAKSIGIEVKG